MITTTTTPPLSSSSMLSQRSPHRNTTSISKQSSREVLSPVKAQFPGRRPSFSNTISWLSRSATSPTSQSHGPSRPRISGPRLLDGYDPVYTGTLGAGATVVRTPEEALTGTNVQLFPAEADAMDAQFQEDGYHVDLGDICEEVQEADTGNELPSPPHSPNSPPFPPPKRTSILNSKSAPHLPLEHTFVCEQLPP